jgi:hypothetical protein
MPDDENPGLYSKIVHGAAAAIAGLVFIIVYVKAVQSVGWVIGIALGWIPAALAAVIAYGAIRYLWWLLLLAVAALAAWIFNLP